MAKPSYGLESFLADCRRAVDVTREPPDCVAAIAPLMRRLLASELGFVTPAHLRDDPDHYARNAIHLAPDGDMSLFCLVWNPGQWTPIHDHGSWGVVGVVRGVLEEENYIRVGPPSDGDDGIDLRRGGVILLAPGTVTTFVPNPDHIHKTGVSAAGAQTVSLHLYGRILNDFNVYDPSSGTRRKMALSHNES